MDSNDSNTQQRKIKTTKISTDITVDNPKDVEAIQNIIAESIQAYQTLTVGEKRTLKHFSDNIKTLKNILSEYVNDYLLIAHSADGERIVIKSAKTPAEDDALNDLARQVFVKSMVNDDRDDERNDIY